MKSRYSIVLLVAVCATLFSSCHRQSRQLLSAEEQLIAIDSSLDAIEDSAYLLMLEPRKQYLNEQLDVVIGRAPEALTVGRPECTMLNWACDALYDMAVLKTGRPVDFAVVNIGGMRCDWSAGDITLRHVYELMPFDNKLVILTLKGHDVLDLLSEYARQGGQGVSRQLRMEMSNGKAQNILLNGKPIVASAVYYVAASDYLAGGADHFDALSEYIERYDTDELIRDLYMEHVRLHTEVTSQVDGRMKQL